MTTNDRWRKLEWQYLAEGNSSIVFSCVDEAKVVIRVKKHYQIESLYKENKWTISTLENNSIYVNDILKSLFNNDEYFISTDVISLSEEDREKLKTSALTAKLRPDKRRQQNFEIGPSAMVMPHLGFLGSFHTVAMPSCSYAIEIKPKWGFLFKMSNTLMGNNIEGDISACRFCIHQYLKMKAGVISSISPYCPLDLFANCSCRLKRALQSLFQEPQNNLRLFHNGKLIYSGLTIEGIKDTIPSLNKSLNDISMTTKGTPLTCDALIDIVLKILIHDSWQGMESNFSSLNCTASSTPICSTKERVPMDKSNCFPLGQMGILKRLVRLQQICSLDASTIKSFIQVIKEQNEPSIDLEWVQDYTSKHWENFVARFKDKCLKGNGSTEELVNNIQSFLVSATFKDCSIMITFTKYCERAECSHCQGAEHSHCEGAGGSRCVGAGCGHCGGAGGRHWGNIVKDGTSNTEYAYSIKLIDLDPKQLKKIDYYEQLDHDIQKVYKEHFENNS